MPVVHKYIRIASDTKFIGEMSMLNRAGDLGMKMTVVGLLAITLGLVGSTFSQMGFLVSRRLGGEDKNKPQIVDNKTVK